MSTPKSARIQQQEGKRYTILAFMTGIGGLLLIIIGFVLLIIHSVDKGDTILDEVGTGMMFFSFPMLFLAGHFMDRASEKK